MGRSKNAYLYFMTSDEYVSNKNEVEAKLGRRFVAGTVVYNGVKKYYAYSSTSKDNFLNQYPDAKIVAEGYSNSTQFTNPSSEAKKGN